MTELNQIMEFARDVAEHFTPHKIILFGSHAYGTPTGDSDVDLLVIMPYEGRSWRQATAIRQAVRAGFPLDLLVRSPEEVRTRVQLGDPFLKAIVRQGRVLYESNNR